MKHILCNKQNICLKEHCYHHIDSNSFDWTDPPKLSLFPILMMFTTINVHTTNAICMKMYQKHILSEVPDGSVVDPHVRDIKCTVHDLELMGSNPNHVKLWVRSRSVKVILEPTHICWVSMLTYSCSWWTVCPYPGMYSCWVCHWTSPVEMGTMQAPYQPHQSHEHCPPHPHPENKQEDFIIWDSLYVYLSIQEVVKLNIQFKMLP